MQKTGSVWRVTNHAFSEHFSVNPRWISNWLQSGHLTLRSARIEYVRCGTSLTHSLSSVEVLGREQQNLLLTEKKVIIDEALRGELCTFREVPAKGPFSRTDRPHPQPLQAPCARRRALYGEDLVGQVDLR